MQVFPACAGMDRNHKARDPKNLRVPRMRGDGPCREWSPEAEAACSPHARGWTDHARADEQGRDVFPACAGMDRPLRKWAFLSRCVPRMRGDGPRHATGKGNADKCSPHARGWTVPVPLRSAGNRVFPACAGMDRHPGRVRGTEVSVPRMRGDGPALIDIICAAVRCSPHARGWTDRVLAHVVQHGVFPACAGMDRALRGRRTCRSGVPRMRGDGPRSTRPRFRRSACSPHARGWTGRVHSHLRCSWVFPACAGMDRSGPGTSWVAACVPRMRGDGPLREARGLNAHECSPHARGWTVPPCPVAAAVAVFPACAGMDRPSGSTTGPGCCVPRMRGDGSP